jgi:hypothetical protein
MGKHEGEYITIGKYYLEWDEQGKLWIEIDGEGGEFDEAKLAAVIGTFYNEHF